MVSPQLIIVGIAIIGFFATGGLGKVSGAISTAKNDFTFAKNKITDFQLGLKGQEKIESSEVKKEVESIKDQPIKDINVISHGDPPPCLSCQGLGDAQMPKGDGGIGLVKDPFRDPSTGLFPQTGGKQTFVDRNKILNNNLVRGFP